MLIGWNLVAILYIIALLGCSMGWKYYIWFLSAGYGGAVSAIGIADIVMMCTGTLNLVPTVLIQALIFIVYGMRLCIYTMRRDLKNKEYVKVIRGEFSSDIPFFAKFFIWLYCGALYVAQTSGAFFRLYNNTNFDGKGISPMHIVGLLISVTGACLEAIADKQKTEQKKENVNMVATKGLYKMCRCPNYFGEILFWTGHFVGAFDILKGGQWIMATIGEILIVFIMFNGAQRLEKRQDQRYGGQAEYDNYIKKTPIIIPVIPLYHLYDPAKEAAKQAKKEER